MLDFGAHPLVSVYMGHFGSLPVSIHQGSRRREVYTETVDALVKVELSSGTTVVTRIFPRCASFLASVDYTFCATCVVGLV